MSNAKSKGIFFGKKKLVSNDSELSNSARNGKKKIWRQMAIFGGRGGTAAVFLNIREICPKSKLLPFLTIGLK